MRVLGIEAVFHDSAAALVVDGRIVAAAEEERFRLAFGGIGAEDLDAIAYFYVPGLALPEGPKLHDNLAGPHRDSIGPFLLERAPR